MSILFGRQTKEQYETDVLVEETPLYDLVIYNDDVNTFDHVIKCLIEICDHDELQAEQCTILIHYKGRCGVKRGEFDELRVMCEALLEKGLSAKVE